MAERVAVVFAERALGGSADVRKNQARGCLGGETLEVGAVPGRGSRSEEAGCSAQLGIGVEANAEAIGIVLTAARVLCNPQPWLALSGMRCGLGPVLHLQGGGENRTIV